MGMCLVVESKCSKITVKDFYFLTFQKVGTFKLSMCYQV